MSCAILLVVALGGDLVPYTVEEAETYLKVFVATRAEPTIPEEDAVTCLRDLEGAYRFFASKGERATKAERQTRAAIVATVAAGLKTESERVLVTLECARTLGKIGDVRGSEPLGNWLAEVCAKKSPNPQWVEYGMKSLAWIGAEDGLKILASRVPGAHAVPALKALREFRRIDGETRRWLFRKLLADLEPGEEGVKTLSVLAGQEFKTLAEARNWWESQRWPDYVGPRFR